jgi:hypothetical protein
VGAATPGIFCGEAVPALPICVIVPLSLGANVWLFRLSTSEADDDDGDSPIPVPGIIASEVPGLSAERETGGGRRGPFDVMWGPDAG